MAKATMPIPTSRAWRWQKSSWQAGKATQISFTGAIWVGCQCIKLDCSRVWMDATTALCATLGSYQLAIPWIWMVLFWGKAKKPSGEYTGYCMCLISTGASSGDKVYFTSGPCASVTAPWKCIGLVMSRKTWCLHRDMMDMGLSEDLGANLQF